MEPLSLFSWPAAAIPVLRVAGRFPLEEHGFATRYRSVSHALHLHGYAGGMELCGARVALKPGDLTLSPAGLESAYDLPAPGHHWCIHFMPAQAPGPVVSLPAHLPLGAAAGYAAERIAHIARLQARGRAAGSIAVAAAA